VTKLKNVYYVYKLLSVLNMGQGYLSYMIFVELYSSSEEHESRQRMI
jgi:hypothetical protein